MFYCFFQRQFYTNNEFLLYNMFNNHFFESEGESTFNNFLKRGKDKLALIIDPPFGGKIEVLACTLKAINSLYKDVNGENCQDISGIGILIVSQQQSL